MRTTTSALLKLFLEKGSKKWRPSQLLEKLHPLLDEALLEIELEALVREGWLIRDERGRYTFNLLGRTFTGEVQVKHEEAFLLLAPFELRVVLGDFRRLRLLPGEIVEVEITALYPEQVIGRVIRRIAPSRRTFIGVVEEGRNRRLYVTPQQPSLEVDFQLSKDTPAYLVGQKVAVRFLDWGLRYPIGEVIQVLGPPRHHHTEMHAILMEFDLPEGFSEAALAEAAALPEGIPTAELHRRHDFRGLPTFTIDPEDAKDFDDALSLRLLSSGLYEVGVHIADVSFYVQPNSALDHEAAQRGTSVYLVDRTLPMLPERLSSFLCSLLPNQDRLSFSIIFQLDAAARIHAVWMGRGIIRSQYRFTYEEAQQVLETGKGPFAEELRHLHNLAQKLHNRRLREGGVRFETDEVKFLLDEQFTPIKLFLKTRKATHRLIEEFMLLANRQVATFLSQLKSSPAIYRVHEVPKLDKLRALQIFLEGFGYAIDISNPRALTRSLNALVEAIAERPEAHIIQAVAIRSMPKALYTTSNIGHYGLGFTHYTHFTSPIRRYPDLLTHRILAAALEGKPTPYPDVSQLEALCRQASERERIAEQAERASVRYKQLEYLARCQGQPLAGIIVGIENWGLYVELSESRIEGFVPLRNLPSDIYERDSYGHLLKGRYTRRRYRLGDPVEVEIERIDFDKRQMDLRLLRHQGEHMV
ncbi:MAG: ribonuclease R [Bacteroidia bacterium]|nr:ribonuclease R [Bacteroidia bacterium]MDW8088237.1 ribonuclease R [Bacteroidia bacterium]